MSEPITKELREYITSLVMSDQTEGKLRDLCDDIDAITERGWVKLPVDADGVPIQIGDAVEHNGVVANVLGITFHGTTPPTVCICRGDCWVEADTLRHHRPDTWESIISDAMRAGRAEVTVDVMPLIKRCKALAGEDE